MEKILIIGGGVAGLSCLNALLDRGYSALLLESAKIGTPKMCGEFLAPTALAQLACWDIGPLQFIDKIQFLAGGKSLNMTLPECAGGMSRSALELQLAARARRLGGLIQEDTAITKIIPATLDTPFSFQLQSGEMLQAETVFFATGRFGNGAKVAPSYYGVKLHLPKLLQPETLLMFSMPQAYFGIVPIADNMSNLTGLVKVSQAGSGKEIFAEYFKAHLAWTELDFENLSWLEGSAPEFGLKTLPNWPRSYWIGDAIGSPHPAIGYGFAHSVHSAVLAADNFVKHDAKHYQAAVLNNLKPKITVGKILHKLLLNPNIATFLMPILKAQQWIIKMLLIKIGYAQSR